MTHSFYQIILQLQCTHETLRMKHFSPLISNSKEIIKKNNNLVLLFLEATGLDYLKTIPQNILNTYENTSEINP